MGCTLFPTFVPKEKTYHNFYVQLFQILRRKIHFSSAKGEWLPNLVQVVLGAPGISSSNELRTLKPAVSWLITVTMRYTIRGAIPGWMEGKAAASQEEWPCLGPNSGCGQRSRAQGLAPHLCQQL